MSVSLKENFLVYRVRAWHDAEAFAKIYDAYAKPISRFIALKVGGKEQVEDLVADTFVKAWQYLQHAKDVSSLRALLYRVARSVIVDHYRKTAPHKVVSLDDEESGLEEPPDAHADDIPDHVDAQLLITKLSGLRNDYREILVLKYVEGLDTDEIAQALGTTKGNVRVLSHRALAALKTLLTKTDVQADQQLVRADRQ